MTRDVPPQYKGAPLDPAAGPGLGCFRIQVVVLASLLVVTPIGVASGWPLWLTTSLLFLTLGLLFFTGQTIIFLLRLVAADRRSRRRPLGPTARRTVGEIADDVTGEPPAAPDGRAPSRSPDDHAPK